MRERTGGGKVSPVAIGAIGGSGTRVLAQFLQSIGFYIGSDLNGASDNLWFTLLFKRPEILSEPSESFMDLAELFYGRMTGQFFPNDEAEQVLTNLALRARPQYSREWLLERAQTLSRGDVAGGPGHPWGWKEPNTHVVVDRLLEFDQSLRYIHLTRHGLDMAFSRNQHQLSLWGPHFLGRKVEATPRDSLAYWCAIHRRIRALSARFEERVLLVDFDRLCAVPQAVCREVLAFIGQSVPDAALAAFAGTVKIPVTAGRWRPRELTEFDPEDLAYVERCGYQIKFPQHAQGP